MGVTEKTQSDRPPPGSRDFGDTDVTLTVTEDKGDSDICDATVAVTHHKSKKKTKKQEEKIKLTMITKDRQVCQRQSLLSDGAS